MKIKNLFIIILLAAFIILTFLIIKKSNSSTYEKNLENKEAEVTLTVSDLIENYTKNEEKSDSLYAGKIIEIIGFVDEVTYLNNRNTIILNSNSETFGVICDINPSQKEKINQLKKNQKIQVKGICKGFLKDVILLNCTIELKPNE